MKCKHYDATRFFLGCQPIWREVSLGFISEVVNGLNHSSSSDGWPAHKHQGSEILWMAIGAARVLITAAFNNYCWQKRRGATSLLLYDSMRNFWWIMMNTKITATCWDINVHFSINDWPSRLWSAPPILVVSTSLSPSSRHHQDDAAQGSKGPRAD